ncbi:MAG: FAD-dependent oxidoreductase [Bacteroidota bacterium]|nr:FAD-dependent oxidoreductase [Bacteroidota bacterium]
MQQNITLKLLPREAENSAIVKEYIAHHAGTSFDSVTGFFIQKKSIDARGRQPFVNISLLAFINEPFLQRPFIPVVYKNVAKPKHKVIIIGAGPAGLFAALQLIQQGIQAIILERGKDVRSRRRDLAVLNKEGIINNNSNYCFGEGGAGTYSDGKLYTRSTKRGNVDGILSTFVQFGAEESILYNSHPHIGTNKLPQIITAMRHQIEDSGGLFLFDKKAIDLIVKNDEIKSVITADNCCYEADAVILATGHSARDVFQLLHNKNIAVEAKPFALGARVEHPQSLIDSIQYHQLKRDEHLPPSSYSLVQQVDDKGVFSFCMCPGGIIAPAATESNALVVNGWSPSKRNNPFANSGVVVTTDVADAVADTAFAQKMDENKWTQNHPLLLMYFQQMVEEKAYNEGGGNFVAPAQRMTDFCANTTSPTLPNCSYVPGVSSASLAAVLPSFIYTRLQKAFVAFGKKMRGYYTDEAIVVATESRTSSPVRIPRNSENLQHPQIKNLYPCGEGAGYAGGIVSAAIDGERVANAVAELLRT